MQVQGNDRLKHTEAGVKDNIATWKLRWFCLPITVHGIHMGMITPMLFARKGSISFGNLGGRLIIVIYVETLTPDQFDVFAVICRIQLLLEERWEAEQEHQ